MFADDTNLFFSEKDIDHLVNFVNSELEKRTDWFKANTLSLNVKKQFVIFRTHNKKIVSKFLLKIDNIEIIQDTLTKCLSVIINH